MFTKQQKQLLGNYTVGMLQDYKWVRDGVPTLMNSFDITRSMEFKIASGEWTMEKSVKAELDYWLGGDLECGSQDSNEMVIHERHESLQVERQIENDKGYN